ncbi:hypothetical protein [Bradyrhizobium genosp. P]|uniref:hypothetical protein n=1 Tax=Bradyrhizobium genosp. P TaxID=83641 RepID=UPI003CEAB7B1
MKLQRYRIRAEMGTELLRLRLADSYTMLQFLRFLHGENTAFELPYELRHQLPGLWPRRRFDSAVESLIAQKYIVAC